MGSSSSKSSKSYKVTDGPVHVLFYHGPTCKDGNLCKHLIEKSNKEHHTYDNLKCIPCVPGSTKISNDNLFDCIGKNVCIADITFSPDVMNKIYDNCESLIVIDHHKTGFENCKNLNRDVINIDTKICASRAVFNTFFKNRPRFFWSFLNIFFKRIPEPLLIKFIDREDTGIAYNEGKETRVVLNDPAVLFCNNLKSRPNVSYEDWEKMLGSDSFVESIVETERTKIERVIQKVEEIVEKEIIVLVQNVNGEHLNVAYWKVLERWSFINYVGIAMINKGVNVVSGVTKSSNDDCTFRHSLRGSIDIDLADLAKSIDPNGGGHPGAASCVLKSEILPFEVISFENNKE